MLSNLKVTEINANATRIPLLLAPLQMLLLSMSTLLLPLPPCRRHVIVSMSQTANGATVPSPLKISFCKGQCWGNNLLAILPPREAHCSETPAAAEAAAAAAAAVPLPPPALMLHPLRHCRRCCTSPALLLLQPLLPCCCHHHH